MSEQDIIQKAITAYRIRWKIEEVHRQMKQNFKWEKMRLASYTKLKNLKMLMTISLYFVYSCKDVIEKIAVPFQRLFASDQRTGESFTDSYTTELPKYYRFACHELHAMILHLTEQI